LFGDYLVSRPGVGESWEENDIYDSSTNLSGGDFQVERIISDTTPPTLNISLYNKQIGQDAYYYYFSKISNTNINATITIWL